MRQNEKNLLFNYRLNMQSKLENEVRQLQQNIRYRNIDTIDCHELSLCIERLNTFKEVMKDVTMILGLFSNDSEN